MPWDILSSGTQKRGPTQGMKTRALGWSRNPKPGTSKKPSGINSIKRGSTAGSRPGSRQSWSDWEPPKDSREWPPTTRDSALSRGQQATYDTQGASAPGGSSSGRRSPGPDPWSQDQGPPAPTAERRDPEFTEQGNTSVGQDPLSTYPRSNIPSAPPLTAEQLEAKKVERAARKARQEAAAAQQSTNGGTVLDSTIT